MTIEVHNRQRKVRLKMKPLQEFAERALELCRQKLPNELSECVAIELISDRRMAQLHQQFMNMAGPTDVITFQHGEIFISVDTARQNARRFQSTTENEVQLYLVHGLLHLCGYDDTTAAARRVMEKAQFRIFEAARRQV